MKTDVELDIGPDTALLFGIKHQAPVYKNLNTTMKTQTPRTDEAHENASGDLDFECSEGWRMATQLERELNEAKPDTLRLDFLCKNAERFGFKPQWEILSYGAGALVPDKREGFTDFRQLIDEAMKQV